MSRFVLACVAVLAVTATAAPVEPALLEQMQKASDGEKLGVMIALNEQLDGEHIIRTIKDKQQRWEKTVSSAKEIAERTQAPLLAELRAAEADGDVANIRPMWIANAVYCEAVPGIIERVAQRDEVWFVQWDLIPTRNALAVEPTVRDVTDEAFGIEWNVSKVKADSVWWVHGYTGAGVVVGNIDSGCDYTHPDLADHLWTDPNYDHNGWDFENDDDDPMDSRGHGTHTCGTHSGDGTGGDTTGMAPNSLVMSCRAKTSLNPPYPDTVAENTVMNSMQFCVAPPRSPENHADLLTMSLGWVIWLWSPRQALWRQCVTNVAAAGLPYFICAGNEGSSMPPLNVRCPGNCPSPWQHPSDTTGGLSGAIAIGATDSTDSIASFSSWGPVTWDTIDPYFDYPYPPGLLKPDFSAPGVDVVSTQLGGGYTQMSGTSMATPCAAGVCALMLEKNPTLLPEEVDEIMENSVEPLGTQPKNNTFGTGRIDAMLCIANTPLPGPRHDVAMGQVLAPVSRIEPNTPLAPTVVVRNRGTYVEPSVPVACRIDSMGTQVYLQTVTLSLDSAGRDTAVFPNWTPGPGSQTYDLTFWHTLPNDTNRRNDTVKTVTTTRGHDVAVAGMNVGSQVRANLPFTPAVILENTGDFAETGFTAYCAIDSAGSTVYSDTLSVDSVGIGQTRIFQFPDWNVGPESTYYEVAMWHNCPPDENRMNDTLVRVTMASASVMRVAIELPEGSIGRTPPNACYALDSLCDVWGWTGSIVSGVDIDELPELANYDVVVTGASGVFGDYDHSFYDDALLDWVRSGGGLVTTGWVVRAVYYGAGAWSPMDSAMAVSCVDGSAFVTEDQVRITNSSHPITDGVADFDVQGYGEYANSG
ncbi:MAG: S8 family serine peptidase, partial [candidate division WOR-3 bacterium]